MEGWSVDMVYGRSGRLALASTLYYPVILRFATKAGLEKTEGMNNKTTE
jgi:hypothetical protein